MQTFRNSCIVVCPSFLVSASLIFQGQSNSATGFLHCHLWHQRTARGSRDSLHTRLMHTHTHSHELCCNPVECYTHTQTNIHTQTQFANRYTWKHIFIHPITHPCMPGHNVYTLTESRVACFSNMHCFFFFFSFSILVVCQGKHIFNHVNNSMYFFGLACEDAGSRKYATGVLICMFFPLFFRVQQVWREVKDPKVHQALW